jgi:hypothetical protein
LAFNGKQSLGGLLFLQRAFLRESQKSEWGMISENTEVIGKSGKFYQQ